MADTATPAARDIDGTITDADIERARKQIGIPQRRFVPTFNVRATQDAMRHFTFGLVGDDNPLWHDADYAAKSRWRGPIAHPLFIQTMGENETPPYPDDIKPLFKGLFRGVGKYLASTTWSFYKPVFEGDIAYEEYTTSDIQVKESSFSGGRSVIDSYRSLYVDRAGAPIATREHSCVNAERRGSKEKGKYADREKHVYTPDDIARIDEIYAAEERRGSERRYHEDVEVGETLTPVAKGPLSMVEIISRHIATGMADGYNIGPLRYGWKARQKISAFYTPDDWGVPQPQQRVHWDDRRAQDLGLPGGYDYAIMRFAWLSHIVTNWMGDDGWLAELSVDLRQFNFVGDFHIISGEVTAKRVDNGQPVVEIALKGVNQRGDETTRGFAKVMLPSSAYGPVTMPAPPAELSRRGAEMMQTAAEHAGKGKS